MPGRCPASLIRCCLGQEWSPWVLPCFVLWQEFPLNQAHVLCTPQPPPRAPSAQQSCSVASQLSAPHQRASPGADLWASGRLCSGYAHAFTEPPFMSAPVLHCVGWLLSLFLLAFYSSCKLMLTSSSWLNNYLHFGVLMRSLKKTPVWAGKTSRPFIQNSRVETVMQERTRTGKKPNRRNAPLKVHFCWLACWCCLLIFCNTKKLSCASLHLEFSSKDILILLLKT